jgi:D,D-heptose 1,7-bisphosphate phosphatase
VQPAVFLDRDNTLIVNEGDLGDPALVRLHEGVPAGLKSLRDAGYRLIVVTNQGGVARGAYSESDVDAVHQRIAELVDERARQAGIIDRFYYCPYHPEGKLVEYQRDHPWRKPNPGMLLQAARDMQLDLGQSWLVGDQRRDIAAGQAAGCRTILVTRDPAAASGLSPHAQVRSFSEAVAVILDHTSRSPERTAAGRTLSANGTDRESHDTTERERTDTATRLRHAVQDLAEELRLHRTARAEFSLLRMTAVMCQLLVLLLALLGLLQAGHPDTFLAWMLGAIVVQLFTIALLLMDGRA